MRILIVSDTHRRDENLKEVIRRTGPLDMLIHLGDAEGSEHAIATWVNEDCDLEIILGNNDFFSCLDKEKELMIGRYRTLLTHGHYYNVSVGAEYLKQEARARGFDIVMFGHTHRPFYEVEKNLAHLADVLGHSKIETTRIYVAVSASAHEKTLEKMGLVI